MNQNRQELSHLVQEEKSAPNVIKNTLKKTGKFLYKTIKQSPDANIFFAGYVASYFVPQLECMRETFAFLTMKQYLWGHFSYHNAKMQLDKKRDVSEEAFEKVFSPWSAGPCSYCGSRYALREYKNKQQKMHNV